MPLPFVGSEHADGRIMGLALILPRELDAREAGTCLERILRDVRSGLPQPSEVHVHLVSRIKGVPHSRDFPQLVRKRDGGRMRHTHALVVFAEPVEGPVLRGAGRFRGYGACRPIKLEQC